MIVILDRQHYGKPGKDDLGAGVDLDGDGKVESDEREARLTPTYIYAAKDYLASRGHIVYVLQEGWYSDRHVEACGIAHQHVDQKVAYIACHLNAGGGNYSVTLSDERSKGGYKLAQSIATNMSTELPEVARHLVKECSPDLWTNAYYTIKGIYSGPANISGVCFEPLFMDNTDHQELLDDEGLKRIGVILAQGCLSWAGERDDY
tara:strand:+ start:770 stop:1384 length:615 start_codon:yes stop_codon:yes gene_type:complete